MSERPVFDYVDERTVRGPDGTNRDVLKAIDELNWVRQWCPFMPHQYAILGKSPEEAWYAVEAIIRLSPKSYRAFFRGHQSANRYWEAEDGRRYWRSFYELDRWDANDTTGLRRRDEGARAIKDWDGPANAPNGGGYYIRGSDGRWWPSPKFFDEGYEACLGCRRPPHDVLELVGADRYRVVDASAHE
jgi:hypothetical protein